MPPESYEALVAEWMDRDRARYEPSALVALTYYNMNRGKQPPRKLEDFMPPDHRKAKQTGPSEGVAKTLAFVKAMKTAHDLKKGGGSGG